MHEDEPGAGIRPATPPVQFIKYRMVENARGLLSIKDGTVATISIPSSYDVR